MIEILFGSDAELWLADPALLSHWLGLLSTCTHATAFQAPGFVRSWYRVFHSTWQPLVVRDVDTAGRLVGLWALAYDERQRRLAHAGDEIAPAHSWLAEPHLDRDFLSRAWTAVRHEVEFDSLRFRGLHTTAAADSLRAIASAAPLRASPVRTLALPMEGDRPPSRLAARSGRDDPPLAFTRLHDAEELRRTLEAIADMHDLRYAARDGTRPFRDSPRRGEFLLDRLATCPQDNHVAVTSCDGRTVAASWAALHGTGLHLEMLAHDPTADRRAVARYHLQRLAEEARSTGHATIEIGPVHEAWLDSLTRPRGRQFDVELRGTPSARSRPHPATDGPASPIEASSMARSAGALATRGLERLHDWAREDRELRVYRAAREDRARWQPDARVARDSLRDLLAFEPGSSLQAPERFFATALSRLRQGETVFTLTEDGRLASHGWMVRDQTESYAGEVGLTIRWPANSVVLYSFFTHPEFRGQGLYRALLSHGLHEALADPRARAAYVTVLAGNAPSRHVIESLGLHYERSLHWRRRLGRVRKWSGTLAPARCA